MKTRGVHFTEHEYEDDIIDHKEVDPAPPLDNNPNDTHLIDAITGGDNDTHNDADIHNVLSAYKMKQTIRPRKDKDKQEAKVHIITVNGHDYYRKVNQHITFRACKSISNRTGSLVDRRANGGVAGNDVKVWSPTGRKVDVAGIDNQTMNDLEIVSVAGVVQTNSGPHLVIIPQMAYTGKGETILSCGQIEHNPHYIDDKSRKIGGSQCIRTVDGVMIPLSIRNGLLYMDMVPPTDKQEQTLPKLHLTSDEDWDPRVLDSEYGLDELPENKYVHDSNFTDDGKHITSTEVNNATKHDLVEYDPDPFKLASVMDNIPGPIPAKYQADFRDITIGIANTEVHDAGYAYKSLHGLNNLFQDFTMDIPEQVYFESFLVTLDDQPPTEVMTLNSSWGGRIK
jgi:hypothetical protein